ncbi:unnamed protein product [Ophioblennius macclurei]
MGDANPVKEEVTKFDKGTLKKTDTKEKNPLPTSEDIKQEKKEQAAATS